MSGWSSKAQEDYLSFSGNLENIPQLNKEEPKDVNMEPVGVRNTRISTDYSSLPPKYAPV